MRYRGGGWRQAARWFMVLAALLVAAGPVPAKEPRSGAWVDYSLGPVERLRELYPDASWLPAPYASLYPDLSATVAHFTRQSLVRDGVGDPVVEVRRVSAPDGDVLRVRIAPVNATTERYASRHPQFLGPELAGQALRGAQACRAEPGCWDPQPVADEPWTFFLPLGLPMVSQQAVLFLDYPPVPALTGKDYLNNFTLCRWGRILGAAGIEDPHAFEAIVDARPLAAPGSGEEPWLPDPMRWFDDSTGEAGDYLSPMLAFLAGVERDGAERSRPVAVFGKPARDTWARIVGRPSVEVMDVGSTALQSGAPGTPWIATNHPVVTTYQTCPDPDDEAASGSQYRDDQLLPDLQKDLVAGCWLKSMTGDDPPSASAAREACRARWADAPGARARQTLCVQAKLDDDDAAARCDSYAEAWRYCSAHAARPCASRDCRYDPDRVREPVPPPAQRPVGWADTCNQYRPGG